jgi:hypothetical protein
MNNVGEGCDRWQANRIVKLSPSTKGKIRENDYKNVVFEGREKSQSIKTSIVDMLEILRDYTV